MEPNKVFVRPSSSNDGNDGEKNKFDSLLSLVSDSNQRKKIQKLLNEIERDEFPIAIYEIQIEIDPVRNPLQRTLETISHNYERKSPDAQIKSKRNDIYQYTGQSTYVFIKNRPMWIIRGGLRLLRKNGQGYTDEWSRTDPREIPDFWACDEPDAKVRNIRTSVILPLRFPYGINSSFGFIDFESEKYVRLTTSLRAKFQDIANIFAIHYVHDKINK